MITVGPNLNTNVSISLIFHRATKKKKANEAFIHSIKTNESPKKKKFKKKITSKSRFKHKFTKKENTQLATRAKKNHSTSNHSPYIIYFFFQTPHVTSKCHPK